MSGLEGRVAIVTGGGTGIGKGIVRRLASARCRLLVSAANSMVGAEKLRDELRADGVEVEVCRADLRNPDAARSIIASAVETYGQLDILVNNAGFTLDEPFLDGTTERWQEIFNINLMSMITASQDAARHLIEQGSGRIINISSVHGIVHMPGHAIYAATKGGINGFTRSLAVELAPHQVTCNVIAPGAIQVDRYKAQNLEPRAVGAHIPMRRVGQPAEIAAAVAYLASDEASYVSGEILYVDGALTSRMAFST